MSAAPAAEPVRAGGATSAACLAAGVLLLAACGNTSSGDPLAATKALTKADQRTARLVDIRQDDVPPDYRPQGSLASGRQKCAADLSGLTLTAVDRSRPFVAKGPAGYVLGEVDLYETSSQASSAFRRVSGATRLRCLLGIAHSTLSHYVDGRVAVEPVPVPGALPGTQQVARRFAESWRDTDGTRVETTDDVYLLAGRTFVVLSFFRDRGVFPAAAEAKVIARVAGRALGAKPGRMRTRPGGNGVKGE